jgi:hypothetical protein
MQADHRFGVFRRAGHLLAAFSSAAAADRALQILAGVGVHSPFARRCGSRAMILHLQHDLEHCNGSAAQRRSLLQLHALALRGRHWVLVHADDDVQACVLVACILPPPDPTPRINRVRDPRLPERRSRPRPPASD